MIALLRAVNVAGHKMVAMSDLRDMLTDLGFKNVRSVLQSGNLVFDAPRASKQVEALLGQAPQVVLELDLAHIALEMLRQRRADPRGDCRFREHGTPP